MANRKRLLDPRIRRFLLDILPPVFVRMTRRATQGRAIWFTGPYASWDEAASQSTGYNAPEILARVRDMARSERERPASPRRYIPFPVVAVLLNAAAKRGGVLAVLDYGGSLGSSYLQCRPFLTGISRLRWMVVEQPSFAECGQKEFQSDELRFHATAESALKEGTPHVVLLLGVLQYLADPIATIDKLFGALPDYVIIDLTPIVEDGHEVIAVQHVPPSIYAASYPFRVFPSATFTTLHQESYELTLEFSSIPFEALERKLGAVYRGYVYKRKIETLPCIDQNAPQAKG